MINISLQQEENVPLPVEAALERLIFHIPSSTLGIEWKKSFKKTNGEVFSVTQNFYCDGQIKAPNLQGLSQEEAEEANKIYQVKIKARKDAVDAIINKANSEITKLFTEILIENDTKISE